MTHSMMSNSLEDSRFTLYYVTNELGLKIFQLKKRLRNKIIPTKGLRIILKCHREAFSFSEGILEFLIIRN